MPLSAPEYWLEWTKNYFRCQFTHVGGLIHQENAPESTPIPFMAFWKFNRALGGLTTTVSCSCWCIQYWWSKYIQTKITWWPDSMASLAEEGPQGPQIPPWRACRGSTTIITIHHHLHHPHPHPPHHHLGLGLGGHIRIPGAPLWLQHHVPFVVFPVDQYL